MANGVKALRQAIGYADLGVRSKSFVRRVMREPLGNPFVAEYQKNGANGLV
jgi:hypothetical protein